MQIADDRGFLLDARASLQWEGNDSASITLESQGGGRNKDYFRAHDLLITRLASLCATLVDAVVASFDTRRLDEASRRFLMGTTPYPVRMTPDMDAIQAARMLRRGAAEIARREGATGPGNRAKRVTIRFIIDGLSRRPPIWLMEQLIKPSGAMDVEAVTLASRPSLEDFPPLYQQNTAARKAVEKRAMQVAVDHLREKWMVVMDVSATESFDILCRSGEEILHVEVKGTTSDGATVILTRNEVLHARSQHPRVALYVVSEIDIELSKTDFVASGGLLTRYEPWAIDDFPLLPVSFQYCLKSSPSHG